MPRGERPLDTGDDELLRFAADLRALREKAGKPTYRELGRRAHYSAASLSEAASGRKLPSLAVTLAYVRACDGDADEWESRWYALAGESTAGAVVESDPATVPPYAGLSAFQAGDADRFFGRQRLVDELTARLGRSRLVGVFGASGAGKSSLLRAGLLPRVEPALLFTPGAHPVEQCAVQLAARTGATAGALAAEFRADPRGLHLAVRQALVGHPADAELVIVVDQFEEVFTLCADPAERAGFLALLVAAVRSEGSRCRVVLGVRADFYGHCTAHPELVEQLRDAQMAVPPMSAEELRQAIVRPALTSGHTVESALVTRLVADATGQAGVLPLLSHALLETWRRRRGNAITLAGYELAGGIDGAIAKTAEQVYGTLDERQRLLARQIFLRLIALGEGTEDTKRRLRRAELDETDPDAGVVLERLAAARLLTLDQQGIEIAHEALIRCWPRLRTWLAEDREGLRTRRQLTDATDAWERLERDAGALYRGARLAIARDWAARNTAALTPRERRFLDASSAAEAREQELGRRRTRRLRQLVGLLSVLLVVATTSTGYAAHSRNTATEQRNIALSQKVAADASALREADPTLAAQLSLAAYRLVATADARSSLLGAFATPVATRLGHEINTAGFAPGGRWVATGGDDRTIRIWDLSRPQQPTVFATLPGQPDDVESLRYGPDGRLLFSSNYDGSVGIWNVSEPADPRPLAAFPAHVEPLFAAVPSPDGRVLATAGMDGTIKLWDVREPTRPAPLATLTGHEDTVWTLEFSRDGRRLLSASDDNSARLWDVADPRAARPLSRFADFGQYVKSAAFSPDGATVVTASYDHLARLWDVRDPARPALLGVLSGHVSPLQAVAFGPDGRTVATAGWDSTVRLWDVADRRSPAPVAVLTGHTNTIWSLAFSPDGRTLASASADHSMLLTDVPGPVLAGHPAALSTAAFSPDGRLVALGSEDYTVRLWDVGDIYRPAPLAVLTGLRGAAKSVLFSADGRLVVAAGIDGRVGVWDVANPAAPVALPAIEYSDVSAHGLAMHPRRPLLAVTGNDPVIQLWDLAAPRRPRVVGGLPDQDIGKRSVGFSPDGNLLANAKGNEAQIWDVSVPELPKLRAELAGHTDEVRSVAFAPDGRTLATGGQDRTVRLWDVRDPAKPVPLATVDAHSAAVFSVAFAPDGRTLASASLDRTARLWDVTDPRAPAALARLDAHTDRVYSVAFSRDGRTLLTTSEDHTARLWELDPERVAARVCALAHPRIGREQWADSFPDLAYRPPCPQP
ncbi:hypothetical protein AB0J86_12130 [Micromonospora sp. NPDC049559]|uniref:nSTAND1 domain-containing NTPase n=1 Tax=Micromonospora sp. NPDC049559 TaxID=3155923 RepID=UPI003446F8DF